MATLEEHGKQIAEWNKDSATGPLKIAKVVCQELDPHWNERYQSAADGKNLASWLTMCTGSTGKGLGYYKDRFAAIKVWGPNATDWLHHEAAVWVTRKTQDEATLRKILVAWRAKYRKINKQPLSLSQAKRLAIPILGVSVNRKVDREKELNETIVALENQIEGLGGVPITRLKEVV